VLAKLEANRPRFEEWVRRIRQAKAQEANNAGNDYDRGAGRLYVP
jgi:hypothetical protein